MNFSWAIFVDLGLISITLLFATLLRAKVRFFQKYLIPNALTAGFLLLPFYNFLAPRLGMDTGGLEHLVYHLLSISFICIGLRKGSSRGGGRRIFGTAVVVVSQYTFQALMGLGMTFLFIATIIPTLFPTIGFFVPLGFALGPGMAFSIGKSWETMGFDGAASIGLAFGAFGFMWACFVGVYLLNHGIRKGWLDKSDADRIRKRGFRPGIFRRGTELPVGANLVTETEAIDSMSFNLALVFGVYLLTNLCLKAITFLLAFAGDTGMELAVTLWSISFIFATLIALLVKKILNTLKLEHIIDGGSMNRICGTSVDIMVASAIGAISIGVVSQYWLPFLSMGILGGLIAVVGVIYVSSRIFTENQFHRAIMIYGAMTGTITTGLALLRVLDPEFKTPVASDYMYASGLTFVLVIPMILTINLPARGYMLGQPIYYWITLAVFVGYFILVVVAYIAMTRKNAFAGPGLFRKP